MEKTYGLRAVKLTDIPLKKRMSAASWAARHLCADEDEAQSVLYAALLPSDEIHWVRAQAVQELAGLTMDTWADRIERDSLWRDAWELLSETFESAPSLEVFEHGLELARGRACHPVTAVQYARTCCAVCPADARRQ